jgi:hypothetical protein
VSSTIPKGTPHLLTELAVSNLFNEGCRYIMLDGPMYYGADRTPRLLKEFKEIIVAEEFLSRLTRLFCVIAET